jgi:hypothetical protein
LVLYIVLLFQPHVAIENWLWCRFESYCSDVTTGPDLLQVAVTLQE